MNYLTITIKNLSKEEIINYKLYANRTQSNENRKDILLFDLIKKSADDVDENKIFKKLYPDMNNKASYYRLKNRLLHEINASLVQFYSFDDNGYDVLSELSLSKLFLHKNNLALANYHLIKAEKKAETNESLSLLDLIYTEQINLSIQFGDTSPEIYIKKREENNARLQDTRNLDDALAIVIYKLKRNQSTTNSSQKAEGLLSKALGDLKVKKEYKNNVGFNIKQYNAISRLLLSQQDFKNLEHYVHGVYNDFIDKHYFSKSNHEIKLQMLSYLCNACFMNKEYTHSLNYSNELLLAMKEHKQLLYEKYVFFYYNTQFINYSIVNPNKTINVLNEAKENKSINNHPTHLGYIYLNLAVIYFDEKQHKTALRNIIKLYQHKLFNSIDDSYKLKIQLAEIILRIENKDLEYAAKLLTEIKNIYKSIFQNNDYSYEADFIHLLTMLIKKYQFAKNKQSQSMAKTFCEHYSIHTHQNIVDYRIWLSEKFNLSA